MRNVITIISLIWLSACNAEFNTFSQATIKADCPSPKVVYLPTNNKNDLSERFNFHIYNIESERNTIKFQSLKYDFVFCRAKKSWTVQPGTIKTLLPGRNYTELSKELVNPQYKSIKFQGKTYKYRVVLEPGFILGKDNLLSRATVEAEKDRVVFELLIPNSKPVRHTLYTLRDLQHQAVKSGYGDSVKVGVPRITASLIHGDALWWAIAFSPSEGNTGIATIVSYQPQVGITLIQPHELGSQQITDLVITGGNNPTVWIGTKNSSEGNEYLPAKGLVAYSPDMKNPNSGVLRSYNVHNSPLVGAIPDKLKLDGDIWVATGNGVCQINWQAADTDWTCWRFAAMAKLPEKGVPLYQASTNKTPAVKLSSSSGGDVEVLWWSALDFQTQNGRYEVKYPPGFRVKLDRGASLEKLRQLPDGKAPVDWLGYEWHWQGDRFVRGFDEVASNYFGGGVQGIGSNRDVLRQTNWNTIRGDLELIELSPKFTDLKYYSGWVDQKLLHPYLTVIPQQRPINPQPNPLTTVAKQLQPSSSYSNPK